ncbi:MAG: hypothetical protein KGJ21_00885, partial [Pseudomonadota bacterium]|nr:hypothetical protein [Pseudomonadota bacterium]
CQALQKARLDYEVAETAIAASCQTTPRKGDEAADTKDMVQKSIEANFRKIDILKKMRVFISQLDTD